MMRNRLWIVSILVLGLLLSGCAKKITRTADVSTGDFYSEEEFQSLQMDQRDAYCDELATELSALEDRSATADKGSDAGKANLDAAIARLASLQTRIDSRQDVIEKEIEYFESLPLKYQVVRGDCLWKISGKEKIYADPVKWTRIYRANRDQIKNPNLIYPEQVFSIPRDWPGAHEVIKGECLWRIAGYWEVYDNAVEWTKIYEANKDQIKDPDLIYPKQVFDIPR
ncbi:MAG: LysM peptidoglycan-binding domain-containing protein [Candidatus Krumholzibacteria bacterium]|jgi:nucleoid-associated protein YgaU|nr:LysM peptidoglycan-binding domain-containing protein [Candidatus Krumholzibacteria bacterium]MDP6796509.1 LysM peptidoglycan-binding domain-containing protein [Candidatus Krumholzibacteria bacterium]MDP7021926.1 LysM peptidoglycan-binding domain-containing protein [Candidatus Krumholzibacteria bacterium]